MHGSFFRLLGWNHVWSFNPSRLDSCEFYICVSSLFLLLGFSPATFVTLLFSHSGAGETQALQWFAFPLVFLHPGHTHRRQPVHHRLHSPQGHLPHLFFFFSFSSVDIRVGLWLVSLMVGLSFIFGCYFCNIRTQRHVIKRGWPTRRRPQLPLRWLFGNEHGAVQQPYCHAMCSWTGGPYCHAECFLFLPHVEGGNAVRLFHSLFS